ncbi:MAG: phosphoglycolate phosphatase [Gammaproteobacteria bacterium]|nr:phosphoglycolate phosphatase [Gammaproteobacteria bacterium]
MNKPKLILIDLDGTLVDSVPDLAHCVDEMMVAIGREPYGEARVRDWVGNGVPRLVKRALVGALEGEPSEADFDQAYPIFLERYAKYNGEASQLYPGVRRGLDALKACEITLGCVTNKAEQFTLPLLKALGIYEDFSIVVSGDSLPKKKPDPMPLLHAADKFGASPDECLMVGDSVSDVKAARNAGFHVVCVPYGYNHGNDIHDAEPDSVIDSLADLPIYLRV